MSLQDSDGSVEVINATDEHPFYAEGRGWVGAGELATGDRVLENDGSALQVIANADDPHPEGILVYNFAVEGNHTYFVEDLKR